MTDLNTSLQNPSEEKQLYAVLGHPIKQSLSPKIHQFWMKKHDVNANYSSLPVKADYLGEILSSLPKMGFHGANLTAPLKEAALDLCDELSDSADKIGAVNTIIFKNQKIIGHNTDADGFIEALKKQTNWLKSEKIFVIGAGGAARAVLYALLQEKTPHIIIYNRTQTRAEKLQNDFLAMGKHTQIDVVTNLKPMDGIDLMINASSCGLNGENNLEIDFSRYQTPMIAYDLVYKPAKTKFLSDAEQYSHQSLNGLGMLLYQAAYAFEAWFGIMPAIDDELLTYLQQ